MIPKASQRAGGQQLATHLLNEYDNDRVEVADLRGAIASDLHGAFAEWRAMSKATQCRKYLYSLSLNPDPRQGPLDRALYHEFIKRSEKALGLSDQPRAVVFHVKYGREHCHVVWSRIDGDNLKAVQLSHDRQKLRTVAREFAREHNLRLPPGMENDRGGDRYKDRAKRENLAEKQQEERSGISKQERRRVITEAWNKTATGSELVRALEERGYYLARGDRRSYVVIDHAGEIHSLARQIEGAKTKDIKTRLAAYPIDKLPDARKAQAFIRQRNEQERQALAKTNGRDGLSGEQTTPDDRRAALATAQGERRAVLNEKRKILEARHDAERRALAEAHRLENAGIAASRLSKQSQGLKEFLTRITGIRFIIRARQKKRDIKRAAEQTGQRQALARRHRREREDFKHLEKGLSGVEKRERRSLDTALRRETFRAIARGVAAPAPERKQPPREAERTAGQPRRELTPTQRAALEDFRRAAKSLTLPARDPQRTASEFSKAFERASKKLGRTPAEKTPAPEPAPAQGKESLSQTFGKAADPEAQSSAERARKLSEAFKKAQEQQRQDTAKRPRPHDPEHEPNR